RIQDSFLLNVMTTLYKEDLMRILMLDLDTLRPDHLGCYGYNRNTSPAIDEVAKEGVRFDNYFASDAPCLPSRASLMSGKFGIHTGVVNHGGVAADMRLEGVNRDFQDKLATESLPATLRKAGYKTISISPFAERHSSWTFYAGFSEIHNTGKRGRESAEEISPTVFEWLDNNAEKDNWFLHINYWDPHTPYRAPEEFGNPFENDPIDSWYTEKLVKKHVKSIGPHSALDLNMYDDYQKPDKPRAIGKFTDLNGLKKYIDGYDCGIKYMDDNIADIVKVLKEKGIYDDTVIIITADHGENFGELEIYGEHGTADVATCRIPMIIKWPNGRKNEVDKEFHYNLDLLPTLADIFDLPHFNEWDGESYKNNIFENTNFGREYLVLSQCSHVCQRSVRFGDWLYIRSYHDGYHLFPKEMLFNIKEDPNEQINLAEENKDICKEAVYKLNDWHDEMMDTMPYEVDPLWTVMKEGGPHHCRGKLKKYCERLKETGRGFAVEELKRRHPEEFK
ncbi:MAG: sulfatase, partial [Clostridium sp.]|uniref:sulfatase family protein n=1 Tax=Clostridium sp. TaxID=1506 RepID=UPI0039ECE523